MELGQAALFVSCEIISQVLSEGVQRGIKLREDESIRFPENAFIPGRPTPYVNFVFRIPNELCIMRGLAGFKAKIRSRMGLMHFVGHTGQG